MDPFVFFVFLLFFVVAVDVSGVAAEAPLPIVPPGLLPPGSGIVAGAVAVPGAAPPGAFVGSELLVPALP